MLVTENLTIKLNGKKIKYYKELGYNIETSKDKEGIERVKKGSVLEVKIKDIPKGSHDYVCVNCDYCKTNYSVRYDAYNKQREFIQKDSCSKCRSKKIIEVNLAKYGVENSGQRECVKNKIRKTLYENKTAPCSFQQQLIHETLNTYKSCYLNYTDETTFNFSLDIGFPDIKTYIEYDGSGHDLQVKFGNKTKDEFKELELKRYSMLCRNGWRMIKVISRKDYLPDIKILCGFILEYMDKFNKYIIIDMDKNTLNTDGNTEEYKFENLKITRKKQ